MPSLHRPLRSHRRLSLASLITHFLAFILLLLVGLSLPIIKGVYLLSLTAEVKDLIVTNLATQLKFGVWGFCASSVLHLDEECFGPRLGYSLDPGVLTLLDIPQSLSDILLSALVVALVLHLIAAAFSFTALLFSLYLASQITSILGLLMSIIASVLATIQFGIDVAIVDFARDKAKDYTDGSLQVAWGNGVWMTMVAAIFSWIGVVILCVRVCYCCGIRRKDTY